MTELTAAAAAIPAPAEGGAITPPVSAVGPEGVVPPIAEPSAPAGTELGKPSEAAAPEAVPFDPAKLTLPEGMKADDPGFKSFAEVLGDGKLDAQARGQKLIDLYKDAVTGIRQNQVETWNKTNEDWVKAVKADPDIGGAKFDGVKTSIAKAIDSLGPELSVAFRQGLDATGAGNHPAIWKGLAKMAAALTEGGHVTGEPPSGKPDLATAFFPNSKM